MTTAARVALALIVALAGCASSGTSDGARGHKQSGRGSSTDPLLSLTLMRQASVMLQQGRYDEALEQFEAADRAAPGNATVHNMIGLCHLNLDEYDAAVRDFTRALELAPAFSDARNNRGTAYLATGEFRLAEVDFVAVLGDSTYPHRWQVHYNLGMVYLRQGRMAAAEESFRRVVTSPSPVVDAYLRLAEVKEAKDEVGVAIDLLQEARLKFPDRMEPAVELGRLLIEDGRVEEGRLQLKEAVAKASDPELAERARGMLGD